MHPDLFVSPAAQVRLFLDIFSNCFELFLIFIDKFALLW